MAYKNLLKNVAAAHLPVGGQGAPHVSDGMAGLTLTVAFTVARDKAAKHFSESLAAVVISMELLSLTHAGYGKAFQRLSHLPVVAVTLLRGGDHSVCGGDRFF